MQAHRIAWVRVCLPCGECIEALNRPQMTILLALKGADVRFMAAALAARCSWKGIQHHDVNLCCMLAWFAVVITGCICQIKASLDTVI